MRGHCANSTYWPVANKMALNDASLMRESIVKNGGGGGGGVTFPNFTLLDASITYRLSRETINEHCPDHQSIRTKVGQDIMGGERTPSRLS